MVYTITDQVVLLQSYIIVVTISDRLLKLHGRWKTDAAKDMYVHEDVHNRLEIMKYLGL